MSSQTIKVVTCDVCKKEITASEKYIDAGSYGIHMHKFCALDLSFYSVVRILGLDDIKYMYIDGWQDADKLVSLKFKDLI